MNWLGRKVLHNVAASSALGGRAPHEVHNGTRPDVSRFRAFGCLAYVHIHKERRDGKLDSRGRQCVLLSSGDALYKVYNLESRVACMSKNVTVDEMVFPARMQGTSGADGGELELLLEERFREAPALPCQNTHGNISEILRPEQIEEASAVDEDTGANQFVQDDKNDGKRDVEDNSARYPRRKLSAPDRCVANVARTLRDPNNPTVKAALSSNQKS